LPTCLVHRFFKTSNARCGSAATERWVDAKFIDQFRSVAKAVAADLKLMKVEGEISYETARAREVDRLSIPEWFEKRGISGLPIAVLRAA
jgi:hypothetical protein